MCVDRQFRCGSDFLGHHVGTHALALDGPVTLVVSGDSVNNGPDTRAEVVSTSAWQFEAC